MLFGEERTLGQKLQEDQCSAFSSVFKCLKGPYVEMGLYLWWGGGTFKGQIQDRG